MAYSLKSVFSGSSIFTVGQLLTSATAFLLIPVYTRFLTPEDFGIVGYLLVVSQFLGVVLMFGFHGAQTRFYYEYKENKEEIGKFLFSINIYLIIVAFICCLIFTLFGKSAYSLFIHSKDDIPFYPFFPIVFWTAFFSNS